MNLAVGFPCPTCGHEEANLLGIDKGLNGEVVGLSLLCTRCESVFAENNTAAQEQKAPATARAGR